MFQESNARENVLCDYLKNEVNKHKLQLFCSLDTNLANFFVILIRLLHFHPKHSPSIIQRPDYMDNWNQN